MYVRMSVRDRVQVVGKYMKKIDSGNETACTDTLANARTQNHTNAHSYTQEEYKNFRAVGQMTAAAGAKTSCASTNTSPTTLEIHTQEAGERTNKTWAAYEEGEM